ncbi:hypothetical protein PENSPDRAFT_636237 [Peniophora sp. CONT]|nr:hypothetical protein PENSPDRAFT_636237 [Peniophora sp. CONT]
MASLIAQPKRGKYKGKGGGRRAENERIYGNPLPILFTTSSTSDAAPGPSQQKQSFLSSLFNPPRVINPHCTGTFDPATRSVWVTDERDVRILWTRGFWGKGNLSRSEPSWRIRAEGERRDRRAGRCTLTAEQVTAARRAERAQFKRDRAAAMAAVAAQAEAAYAADGTVIDPEARKAQVPSAATWKPSQPSILTSRGAPVEVEDAEEKKLAEEEEDEQPVEEMEHLQLTLSEAFFLAWALDCLSIADPNTGKIMSKPELWIVFQAASAPISLLPPQTSLLPPTPASTLLEPYLHGSEQDFAPDNPFILNYAVIHHYRSLGWVIKSGVKFCADYLLYKRGPVFSHAEFALILIPSYENETERTPGANIGVGGDGGEACGWQWLATVNRVNAQVMKTLILVYVTVPSRERLAGLHGPERLQCYSVREVTVRRFIPARMRE